MQKVEQSCRPVLISSCQNRCSDTFNEAVRSIAIVLTFLITSVGEVRAETMYQRLLEMPAMQMSGHFRSLTLALPAIAMTGHNVEPLMIKAPSMGMTGHRVTSPAPQTPGMTMTGHSLGTLAFHPYAITMTGHHLGPLKTPAFEMTGHRPGRLTIVLPAIEMTGLSRIIAEVPLPPRPTQ